mmetsp:Transcript_33803/g.68875  ORF Transcript_33803/g.68875 Transcript_33803/m.68875 type:complete len:81 (-) Transcript_33803:61-303(-)
MVFSAVLLICFKNLTNSCNFIAKFQSFCLVSYIILTLVSIVSWRRKHQMELFLEVVFPQLDCLQMEEPCHFQTYIYVTTL